MKQAKRLRLLHTSDWHIGCTLHSRKRAAEHERFFSWLLETIKDRDVEALLVAGDIFNTSSPSAGAQDIYYRFLSEMIRTPCRHVVVIGGNHDSPALLEAPQDILRRLDVHIVGSMPESLEDEVIVLKDQTGAPELIVCAVPYLRDRDVRTAQPGESIEEKDRNLRKGVVDHFKKVYGLAVQKRRKLDAEIPIVGMGHLYSTGGEIGDGVRTQRVGTLDEVPVDDFAEGMSYLALGHLHVPQSVGGGEHYRYSGSILPMGFDEYQRKKSVCLVELDGVKVERTEEIEIPVFQRLERLVGDWNTIREGLKRLDEESRGEAGGSIWLEIIYEGSELIPNLRERVEAELTEVGGLELLSLRNRPAVESRLEQGSPGETLVELGVEAVFERRLEKEGLSPEEKEDLLRLYREVVREVEEGGQEAAKAELGEE